MCVQEVAIKELMAARSRSLRKSTSVPNIAGVRMIGHLKLDNQPMGNEEKNTLLLLTVVR
jgi:hypothetical protein